MQPLVGGRALSGRELEVLQLVAQGLSNAQIADELYLGVNTIKTYIRTAYAKIGAQSRSQAVIWAFVNGLVDERGKPIPLVGTAVNADDARTPPHGSQGPA